MLLFLCSKKSGRIYKILQEAKRKKEKKPDSQYNFNLLARFAFTMLCCVLAFDYFFVV